LSYISFASSATTAARVFGAETIVPLFTTTSSGRYNISFGVFSVFLAAEVPEMSNGALMQQHSTALRVKDLDFK
jgi:hypothetical protein